jgi:hypothetical protein
MGPRISENIDYFGFVLRTLAFGHHEDRTPTHGYAATREAAMTVFAKVGGRQLPRQL